METVAVEYGLILAGTLFALGLISVLVRRNIIFMLISVEIMLNAAGLAFIVAARGGGKPMDRLSSSSSSPWPRPKYRSGSR
jgi:NADH-quinone oxidoreductase subunit K